MRKFALLAALVVSVVVPASVAAATPSVTLSAQHPHVVFGEPVTLAGHISPHAAGAAVSLWARPFDVGKARKIATVQTDQHGRWTANVSPRIATTYQASAEGASSPGYMVHVRPRLSIHLNANGSISATVQPALLQGRLVQLQRLQAGGIWRTFIRQRLSVNSRTTFGAAALPTAAARLRLAMSVNQAGAGFLGGFSAPLSYPAHGITLNQTRAQIGYGDSFHLSGTTSSTQAGLTVRILARPFVQESFQQVATVLTRAGGKWSYRVTPPFMTSYVAAWGNARTPVLTIGIRPAMSTKLLAGDRIQAHVGLAKSVTGKTVQLQQQQPDGSWTTVARMKLDAKATAVFEPEMTPAGTSTLRIAISVNQVGAGFLGGFGEPFVYHR